MTEENTAIANIIEKGVKLSKNNANRSYYFSSFKRTISDWENSFKKIENSDNTKKTEKLIRKMQEDAEKYIENKKDFANDFHLSIIKNPKYYKELKSCKDNLNKIKENFEEVFKIADEQAKFCKEAHEYYETLLKLYNIADIDIAINKIDTNSDKAALEKSLKQLLTISANNEIDDSFLNFTLCYIKNKREEEFSVWFRKECNYLPKFKDLTDKQLLEYQKHGSYLENTESIKQSAEKLKNNLKPIYEFCMSKETSITLNRIAKKALGYIITFDSISGLSIVSSIIPVLSVFHIIIAPTLLKIGLKLLNDKRKPIYSTLIGLIDETNNKIDGLTTSRNTEKSDFNKAKVSYMHYIKDLSNNNLSDIAKEISDNIK